LGAPQWARLKTQFNSVPLRLGAWYRVMALTPLEVTVTAQGKTVQVPRPYVEIRDSPPDEWTVLRNPAVSERTPKPFHRGYLVCPGCRNRVVLPPQRVATQLCPRCSDTFAIAWDERYMDKS
jgi:hypothetical protein